MQVQNLNTYNTNFNAASDISLEYVLKKHSRFLPKRMLCEIQNIVASGQKNMPQLYELHNIVYKKLFEAKNLEELKKLYPEYKNVQELTILEGSRTKALKAIKEKGIDIKDFTLDFMKKLCAPSSQPTLVKEYGFTNRNLLSWLQAKLNIPSFSGSYVNLVAMSNEQKNQRIAELSRKAMYARPKEMMDEIQAKITRHHRTPEYREKKRQEMVNFYKNHPERAEKLSIILRMAWEKCPEIREAMSEYTKQASPFVRKVLSKRQTRTPLNAEEKRVLKGYYRGFWDSHPEYGNLYTRMRLEAIKEYEEGNF